ncbi:YceH family protein [Shewanella sp. D64]|uniref:YceH family protein n=1 Tax=unclassified Shewanella TaxID=196818 RepID=UPI0022BA2D99|nr:MULTISPECIES: YceH family protein [unclassified Shewanella]MEC4724889.1 YceH family protein [Shewanella sp. D64]MEC4736318.1 YceH family protein [Shewanella sp. E94]WBJ97620.1 YceH family protein [Shewanella sp. MTB7]
MNLSLQEARVIGCLLEKEITTPDQYPLSLNSLMLACNQKSSRDPVMSITEADTQAAIDSLIKKRLVTDQTGFGSRVTKYKHRFCNTEFSDLQFNPAQFAIICLLLLRGPQTPGELKTRSGRLHQFSELSEVDHALISLMQKDPALIHQLPKEPGRRDSCFEELMSDQIKGESVSLSTQNRADKTVATQDNTEIEVLSARVSVLEQNVKRLTDALQDLLE